MRNLYLHIAMAGLAALLSVACNKQTEEPNIPAEQSGEYTLTQMSAYYITLAGGKGSYTVTSKNPAIAEAEYYDEYGKGEIQITTKQLGSTVVEVKNNKTGTKAEYAITVIPEFFSFTLLLESTIYPDADIPDEGLKSAIIEEMKNAPSLPLGYYYVLVADEPKTLLIFTSKDNYMNDVPSIQGTYELKPWETVDVVDIVLKYTDNGVDKNITLLSGATTNDYGMVMSLKYLGNHTGFKSSPRHFVAPGDYPYLYEDRTAEFIDRYPQLVKCSTMYRVNVSCPVYSVIMKNWNVQ